MVDSTSAPKNQTVHVAHHASKIFDQRHLSKKGWVGNQHCQFCSDQETKNHLFLTCPLAQQVWFYLGKSQQYLSQWFTWEDVCQHALNQPIIECIGLLIVLSAVCQTLWNHKNDYCFNECIPETARTLIFLIKSLIDYWLGKMNQQAKEATQSWMPVIKDVIPLNINHPNMEIVPYVAPGGMLTPQSSGDMDVSA